MLTSLLYTIGPGVSTGFGFAPLPWMDIYAWRNLMGALLTPWEAAVIMSMSRAYTAGFNAASGAKESNPPWSEDHVKEARKAEVPDILRSGLRALAKRKTG